ncbi:MAG: divalent cation transporter [Cenarchaeum sp. SB0664_bin_35]|nr:divalent cation transporter [Cenarchaeum sp. SB0664_bin_35]
MSGSRLSPKTLVGAILPFILISALVLYITGPGADYIIVGTPLPEVTLERIDFIKNEIQITVRNTGPIPVDVVQADVNDRIQPAAVEPDGSLERFETTLVRIPFFWNEAEPYNIGITIHDGTRFAREVDAASLAVTPDIQTSTKFALAGVYIGVIPVFIGLLWLPFIRRLDSKKMGFFLAITVGLLIFLGVDAIEEALEVSGESLAGAINGPLLILVAASGAFLLLQYVGGRFQSHHTPITAAVLVSIGIGLHNFGEGLALGAALNLGSVAFSASLMVGFAVHNTTEGVAIASPLSRQKNVIPKLIILGLVAGAPAILGTFAGGFAYSPIFIVAFLAAGAGAIFQVVLALSQWMLKDNPYHSYQICGGVALGMIIMYVTGLLS